MNDDNVWGSEDVALPEPTFEKDVVRLQARKNKESWTGPSVEEEEEEDDDGWWATSSVNRADVTLPIDLPGFDDSSGLTFEDRQVAAAAPGNQVLLPFGIDAATVQADVTRWAAQHIPVDETAIGQVDGEPLSVDSTKTVWQRLTHVRSRLIKFKGSNVEREVTSILQSWNMKAKSQPSWDRRRRRPTQQKMKRESIGSELFNWNRTDLPAWTASPSKLTRNLQDSNESLDDANDFGDFESAPPLVIPEESENPARTQESRMEPRSQNPELETSTGLANTGSNAARESELVVLPVSTENIGTDDLLDSTMSDRPTSVPEERKSTSIPTDQTWDFSLFEKQFVPEPRIETESTRPRSNTKTRREVETQETVDRIVSLLPRIEYLLPYS